jgi:hypothetical protein
VELEGKVTAFGDLDGNCQGLGQVLEESFISAGDFN